MKRKSDWQLAVDSSKESVCEDIEGHPLAGDNLMFRKRVSLLIHHDDYVSGG